MEPESTYRKEVRENLADIQDQVKKLVEEYDYGSLYFFLEPDKHQLRLLSDYPNEIKTYRKFMREEVYPNVEPWEDLDFTGFTIGYMCAFGVNPQDAVLLEIFLRYNLKYFVNEQGREQL